MFIPAIWSLVKTEKISICHLLVRKGPNREKGDVVVTKGFTVVCLSSTETYSLLNNYLSKLINQFGRYIGIPIMTKIGPKELF